MTSEEKQQTEQFVRVGAAAMIQGKPLEDVLNIAQTGLLVIEKIRAVETLDTILTKTPRKKT